jgi:hypothetical protein
MGREKKTKDKKKQNMGEMWKLKTRIFWTHVYSTG